MSLRAENFAKHKTAFIRTVFKSTALFNNREKIRINNFLSYNGDPAVKKNVISFSVNTHQPVSRQTGTTNS